MVFNPFNIFILSASIHGLIFGLIVLFSKKIKTQTNKYLAYVILLFSLNNIYFWFLDTNVTTHFGWNYYWLFPIQWDLLLFPAFFYFILSYIGIKKVSKFYMYPFYISLPFFVFALFQQVFFSNFIHSSTIEICYLSLSGVSMFFGSIIIYKGFKLIVNYQNEIVSSNKPKIKTHWLKQLLLFAVVVFLIWVFIGISNTLIYKDVLITQYTTYFLWILMSILIYWMGYLGIYHLGVFNQRQGLRALINSENKKLEYQNSNRFNNIVNIINTERLYTNSSISLQTIAERFKLSEGYVSQLINKHSNTNFSTYINNLRIVEAQRILTDNNYKNYTIIAIALESGFNSKSAFYNAFKKHTGTTPLEYKKQNNLS
jgi:AraC-like DNA-binding protein